MARRGRTFSALGCSEGPTQRPEWASAWPAVQGRLHPKAGSGSSEGPRDATGHGELLGAYPVLGRVLRVGFRGPRLGRDQFDSRGSGGRLPEAERVLHLRKVRPRAGGAVWDLPGRHQRSPQRPAAGAPQRCAAPVATANVTRCRWRPDQRRAPAQKGPGDGWHGGGRSLRALDGGSRHRALQTGGRDGGLQPRARVTGVSRPGLPVGGPAGAQAGREQHPAHLRRDQEDGENLRGTRARGLEQQGGTRPRQRNDDKTRCHPRAEFCFRGRAREAASLGPGFRAGWGGGGTWSPRPPPAT